MVTEVIRDIPSAVNYAVRGRTVHEGSIINCRGIYRLSPREPWVNHFVAQDLREYSI